MPPGKSFTREEVAKHNSKESCWVIIEKKVFDLTHFYDEHPGGADLILKWAGKNGTKAFDNASHSDDAVELSDDYVIGYVLDETSEKAGKKRNEKNNIISANKTSTNGKDPPPPYETLSLGARKFTMDEISKHNSRTSAWVVINNNIYDLTSFLDEHPGGADLILKWAGKDGTKAFDNASHSDDAVELSKDYKIGTVSTSTIQQESSNTTTIFISDEPNASTSQNNAPRHTSAEVAEHNSRESAWVVIGGNVYALTGFLDEHPGGADLILKWAGKDGTKAFDNASHSDDAVQLSEDYNIGVLDENALSAPADSGVPSAPFKTNQIGSLIMEENGSKNGEIYRKQPATEEICTCCPQCCFIQ